MDDYVFVLIMHMTIGAHTPIDDVLSVWGTHQQCLVVAGLYAEDDQRIKSSGVTYTCKRVPFNAQAPKK
jgi:hypothetical protein